MMTDEYVAAHEFDFDDVLGILLSPRLEPIVHEKVRWKNWVWKSKIDDRPAANKKNIR